jgi:hypothetical protein
MGTASKESKNASAFTRNASLERLGGPLYTPAHTMRSFRYEADMMVERVLRESGGSGYIFISEVGGPTFAPAGNFRMGRSCETTSLVATGH